MNSGPSGYPYLNCECNLDDKRFPEHAGRTFYTILSLSPAARWKMDEALDALGAPEDGTVDPDWFQGKRFYAKFEHHTHEGRTRLVVDQFIARDDVKDRIAEWNAGAPEREAAEAAKKAETEKMAAKQLKNLEDEPTIAEPDEVEEADLEEVLDELDGLWEEDED